MSDQDTNESWHGIVKFNPVCQQSGLNLYAAIELTHVLFTKFGAGLDMDVLIEASPDQRIIIVVTEILNICALSDQANEIVKNSDLIGFYHRYATQQL